MNRIALPYLIILSFFYCSASAQTDDWTKLFDGKSLTGWKQLGGKAAYSVDNGSILGQTVPNTPNSFLVTEKNYGDFALELEVRIDDTTANSGVQFRSHFDPAGNDGKGKVFGYQYELDPSARRWTAGIYDEGRRDWLYPLSYHPSAQNAFKLHKFNKVRIECVGTSLRTWINGTPAAYVVDAVDKDGFLALQVHAIGKPEMKGEKIWWKNIRIKPITQLSNDWPKDGYVYSTVPNTLSGAETANGWRLLFNGVDTTGWKGAYQPGWPKEEWEVKDGQINVLASQGKEGGNGGDLVTLKEYSAFDLSFDFLLTPGANSGVKYFVTLSENNTGSAIGLEYQVLDDSLHPDAKLGRDGDRTMASLYDLIRADKQKRFIHPMGSWNTGRIVVHPNNHVEHYLNGIKVLEYDRGSSAYRALVAISKYKVWKDFGEATRGHILLQDHGNAVSFRSIKIRELKD